MRIVRRIRNLAFLGLLITIAWANQVTVSAACYVHYYSECVMNQPNWFMDYELLCSEGCDPPEVPQQNPSTGDYWTTGCGGGKQLWETSVYCVVSNPSGGG